MLETVNTQTALFLNFTHLMERRTYAPLQLEYFCFLLASHVLDTVTAFCKYRLGKDIETIHFTYLVYKFKKSEFDLKCH